MTSTSPLIYAEAALYMGVKEIAGPASHSIIKGWIKGAAAWLNPDDSETAWCACFRGAIGRTTSTGVPKEFFRAKEWLKWGQEVDLKTPAKWEKGDTIIMTRPGGNHVCLLDHVEGKFAFCLGGNQNNEVNISKFLLSKITAVRRRYR